MIYTVTLNPALDKTVEIPHFTLDAVNRIAALRTDPGGKGINVSKVIAKLGGTSRAAGLLAGQTGRTLAAQLSALGLYCDFSYADAGGTRCNLKVIDPANHTNTDINEPGPTVTPAELDALLAKLTASLGIGDIVVLAGSLPAGAPRDTYRTWTAACKAAGAKVFLDADGDLLAEGLKAAPYLVKPNDHELGEIFGRTLSTDEEIVECARLLQQKGARNVLVSMAGDGALLLDEGGNVHRLEAFKGKVKNSVGAGDSMVAGFVAGWLEKGDYAWALRLGSACGSATAFSDTLATRTEIESLLNR